MACGIFLHSAFPSSEIFRAFPKREELLRSLLNADVIGFHTFDYARHFISCCSRMLGLEHHTKRGSILMTYYGRDVHLKILPTCAQLSCYAPMDRKWIVFHLDKSLEVAVLIPLCVDFSGVALFLCFSHACFEPSRLEPCSTASGTLAYSLCVSDDVFALRNSSETAGFVEDRVFHLAGSSAHTRSVI